jgi:hypothetical protein
MDLRVIGWGRMDWIDLTQDRDQWMALANTITFGFHKLMGIYLVATQLLASQERLRPMKLVMIFTRSLTQ